MADVCGALGCRGDPAEVVRHPDHGRVTVCEAHAEGYPTIEEVAVDG